MRDNVVRQAFTVDVFSPTHPPLVENSGQNLVQVQAACSVEYAAAYRLRACQAGLRASLSLLVQCSVGYAAAYRLRACWAGLRASQSLLVQCSVSIRCSLPP